MATTTVETKLIALEKEFWQAMKDNDVDAALRLTDDPCIVTGAQGVSSIDHQAFRAMMTDGKWELLEYDFSDVQARQLTEDVAVVGYKVTEKLTVEGKPLTLVASDSSTWVRRNGKWVCALHTEAVSGDPFGRDKSPPSSQV